MCVAHSQSDWFPWSSINFPMTPARRRQSALVHPRPRGCVCCSQYLERTSVSSPSWGPGSFPADLWSLPDRSRPFGFPFIWSLVALTVFMKQGKDVWGFTNQVGIELRSRIWRGERSAFIARSRDPLRWVKIRRMYCKPRVQEMGLEGYELELRHLSLSLTLRIMQCPSVCFQGIFSFTVFPLLSAKFPCFIISAFFQLNNPRIIKLCL